MGILILLYIPVGLVVADVLAGTLFYVANKTMPVDLSLDLAGCLGRVS